MDGDVRDGTGHLGDISDTVDLTDEREPLGSGETVLMVEDNPEVCVMGEAILSDLGYAVVTAASADEAMEMIESGLGFDLLFTDIVMPGALNGVQLAQAVRRRDPAIGILLTTGWSDKVLDEAGGRDAFDLIGKPYRRLDLARKLRGALGAGKKAA
jgi:CheY-like chemotaxis protein